MARECSEKKKSPSSTLRVKQKAHTTNMQEEKEDGTLSYKSSVTDIHATICTMSHKKRDKLLEKLIEKGSNEEDAKSQADEKDF
jgi:hypothetical protein